MGDTLTFFFRRKDERDERDERDGSARLTEVASTRKIFLAFPDDCRTPGHPDAATKKKHQAVTRLRDTRASRGSRGVLRRDRGRVRAYLAVVPRRGVVLLPLERLRRVRVPLGHGVPRLLGLLGRALTKVPARISRGRAGSGPHPPRERASTPREKSPRVRDRRTTSAGSRRKGPRRARARWRNGVVFAVVVVVVTASYSSSSEVRFRRFVNHVTKSSYRDPRKCEVLNCRFGESAKSRENLRGARLPKSFLSRSPRGVPHSGEAHDPRFERRSRSTREFCADAFRRPGARKDRDARRWRRSRAR